MRDVEHSFVDDGYHEAMGIPLLAGRTFTSYDLEEASTAAGLEISPVELPVVINRTMAEKLWPGEEPLEKIVRPRSAVESYRARVVGVVEDVRQWGAEYPPLSEMYFPYTSEVWGPQWLHLVVRTTADPSTMAEILHQSTGRLESTPSRR